MARLANKVAVITGGAAGIGLAVGSLFAEEGAKVLLVDVDEGALRKAASQVGGDAVSYAVADVTLEEQVRDYTRIAIERFGGIDVFINNAGIMGQIGPITDYPVEVFDKVMAVNVRGAWLGLKHVIPEMVKRGGGSIVITSSIAGVGGGPGISAYAASKHAVIGIMRAAAIECAPAGIRVNTVNPGFTETRMVEGLEEQMAPGAAAQARQGLLRQIPLRRYATTLEVARMMLFLASDESGYCTGGVYMVDGGIIKQC